MAVGIGASGHLGIAFETTYGTYVAPTKFFPITDESLHYVQDTVWRRPVRGTADVIGPVAGNVHTEGSISCEALEDVVAYFHHASRATVAKSGATNYTYVFTPAHSAVVTVNRSLSITVVRNGVVFGYTGCVVSKFTYTVDNGLLMVTFDIVGSDEAVQSLPTPTFTTTTPFGAGQYSIEFPTGTPVFDTDTFTYSVDDHAEPQYRLRSPSRGATFVKYGERDVTLDVERDFESRTAYDAYKALTAENVSLIATKGANNKITLKVPAGMRDDYQASGIGAEGDLVRASMSYRGVYDTGTSKSYEITVLTQENIT